MGNTDVNQNTEDMRNMYDNTFNYDEYDNLNIKTFPLLLKTQKPVVYSTFNFGGFDFLGFIERYVDNDNDYFNKLANLKQRYINGDFNSLQEIEGEYKALTNEIYSETKNKNLQNPEFKKYLDYFLKQTNFNRSTRIKIIDALGGVDACSKIYTYNFDKTLINEYIYLPQDIFPQGVSIMQFEDYTGRKGVAFKLINKTDLSTKILVCHQRSRETAIVSGFSGGELWTFNSMFDIDEICKYIKSLINGSNRSYRLYC